MLFTIRMTHTIKFESKVIAAQRVWYAESIADDDEVADRSRSAMAGGSGLDNAE